MTIRAFKYVSPFLIYAGALHSFFSTGWVVFIPIIYAWILVPLAELFAAPDEGNLSAAEEEMVRKDKIYDILLYLVVPFQYAALAAFLFTIYTMQHSLVDIVGKTMVMGFLCGTFGINVGHELGHRTNKFELFLSKLLLLTSLYMHFFIEHNKGHHKNVATPHDPSSARMGESVYAFYLRSIFYSYISAWRIANRETSKKTKNIISLKNEMIRYSIIQIFFLVFIFAMFGWMPLLLFIMAAINGILLLETVNYIEHYGLQRKQVEDGKYERALPEHSWNSNHVIGRVMLFELSRHSDHHYLASRKYQVLRHHENSPQMPTGYPGMMLLSLLPPAWFTVMDKKLIQLKNVTKSKM
ncbi:MAG: alkane 1-monooxygenase [Chitinophagaceae bacterium]